MQNIQSILREHKPANPELADFPTAHHELAFRIAMYFDEQYGFWVRQVQNSFLLLGQIESEFWYVRAQRKWNKTQQAKILMKILKGK